MAENRPYRRGGTLAALLDAISAADAVSPPDYGTRNRLILLAISSAVCENVRVGFRPDPREPEWPVVYFELPTGQVSWHVPMHDREWDGHDADAKRARIRAFLAGEDLIPLDVQRG